MHNAGRESLSQFFLPNYEFVFTYYQFDFIYRCSFLFLSSVLQMTKSFDYYRFALVLFRCHFETKLLSRCSRPSRDLLKVNKGSQMLRASSGLRGRGRVSNGHVVLILADTVLSDSHEPWFEQFNAHKSTLTLVHCTTHSLHDHFSVIFRIFFL